jgi:hypothetical protein
MRSLFISSIIWAVVLGCQLPVEASVVFSENFNASGLPGPFLEQSGGSPLTFSGGAAVASGASRGYLRTVDDDYHLINFVAQVTVTISDDTAGNATVFFGLGVGEPNPGNGDEPSTNPNIYMAGFPTSFSGGGVKTQDNNAGQLFTAFSHAGTGTHRLQMAWDSANQSMVFSIDRNYAGGPFVADTVFTAVNGTDNGFNSTNSRIFFGGSNSNGGPAQFDDVVVVPEATSLGMLLIGCILVLHRRRGLSHHSRKEFSNVW